LKSFTKFALRFGIYLLVIAYLAADLFLFNGPLNRQLRSSDPNSPEAIAKAKANGVVARVFNHQITRTQLNRAIHQRLWLEGRSSSELSPGERKLVAYAALGELIDHELLRVKTKVNTHKLLISGEEIEQRLENFVRKFSSRAELESAMHAQGIKDTADLKTRIAARIQQEKYVAMRVDPLVEVSEEEISDFYDKHYQQLFTPERIRVRHIFIPTLGTPSEQAKQMLTEALRRLTDDQVAFPILAKEISQDTASSDKGGDLGWMSKKRLPEDFSEAVFSLPLNQPELIQTTLGWHIVEVTDRRDSLQPWQESLHDEIRDAIYATKRHQAVEDFRSALRRFEAHKIDIFHDQIGR
jgi:parvulin-like peptidyl-prolyl isomerase